LGHAPIKFNAQSSMFRQTPMLNFPLAEARLINLKNQISKVKDKD